MAHEVSRRMSRRYKPSKNALFITPLDIGSAYSVRRFFLVFGILLLVTAVLGAGMYFFNPLFKANVHFAASSIQADFVADFVEEDVPIATPIMSDFLSEPVTILTCKNCETRALEQTVSSFFSSYELSYIEDMDEDETSWDYTYGVSYLPAALLPSSTKNHTYFEELEPFLHEGPGDSYLLYGEPSYLFDAPSLEASSLGAEDSSLADSNQALIMYVRFGCPFCSITYDHLTSYLAEHPGTSLYIKYLYSTHHDEIFAHALECAGEYGKFREMFELLMKEARREDSLAQSLAFGKDLGFPDEFKSCLTSKRYTPLIKKHYDEAERFGIRLGPVFVQGHELVTDMLGPADLTSTTH